MRTPMFQKLKKVVNEAKKENIDKTVTRRQLLKAGAAFTVLAAVPKFLYDSSENVAYAADKKIAIIGGGLSGLTAAYQLSKANIEATIYEGQPRTGGRCWTNRNNYFEDGQYYENAGEFIDSVHTDMIALSKELGLSFENYIKSVPKGSETKYHFNGKLISEAELVEDFRQVVLNAGKDSEEFPVTYKTKSTRAIELDNMSVKDWVEKYVPGGLKSNVGQFIKAAYEIEYGAEISDISSLALVQVLGSASPQATEPQIFGESDEAFHIKGGNDQVTTLLSEKLNKQIKRNYWLTKIEKVDKQYKLTFKNGETELYDMVLLTTSFASLRANVDFSKAGFKPLKVTAINEYGMGSNAKLVMQFNKRIWYDTKCSGQIYGDLGFQAGWEASRAQPGDKGLLLIFKGGNAADDLSKQTETAAAKEHLAQLEKLFPGITEQWTGKARINYFKYDPWVGGSYSYYKVGQYTKFCGVEKEREGNVFFAGEHTSADYQGFMNGAVESGNRVAKEMIEALKTI